MELTILCVILVLLLGPVSYILWTETIDEESIILGTSATICSGLALLFVITGVWYHVGHYKATVIDTQTITVIGDNGDEFERTYVFVATNKDGYAKRYEYIGKDKYDVPRPGDKIDLVYRDFYNRYEMPEGENDYKISEIKKESS